jgi:hypothetical protein
MAARGPKPKFREKDYIEALRNLGGEAKADEVAEELVDGDGAADYSHVLDRLKKYSNEDGPIEMNEVVPRRYLFALNESEEAPA